MRTVYLLTMMMLLAGGLKAQLTVTNGYVGNSFNGSNQQWVQNYINEIEVSSDGTVYTASTWDEAGRCIGYYKDGQPMLPIMKQYNGTGGHKCWGWGTASDAIAVTDTHFFVVNCDGDLLRFNRSNHSYIDKTAVGTCVGATHASNKIYLVKANDVVEKRDIQSLGTVELSISVTGASDIATDASGNMWILTKANKVLKYTAAGVNTGVAISGNASWKPQSVSISNTGKLIVCDNGPDLQVKIFDITLATPQMISTLGDSGGISSGTPGIITPKKFWSLAGAGTDASGNMYVATSENGNAIRKFSGTGDLTWEIFGLMFTDMVDVDPASDGKDIYGVNERMTYDFTNHKWSPKSITVDRINQPSDPRSGHQGTGITTTLLRRVQGNLIMFLTGMYAGYFDVYRMDGEIAKLCTKFTGLNWAGYPDRDGNIWYESGGIKKIPLTGFNAGCPVFGPAQTISTIPAPLNTIERLTYDVETDVMWLSGWTVANPNSQNNWGLTGSTLARYPNWSSGNRTASHTTVLPKDGTGVYAKSLVVCKDYVFVSCVRDRGKVYVYKTSDLSSAGFINPPSGWGPGGWSDIVHSVNAFKRSNGTYMIFQEENNHGKVVVYEWCPTGNCTTVIATASFANNGFETPVTNTYTYGPYTNGWVFDNQSGVQRNKSAFGASNAPEGVQTCFLQRGGSITQAINISTAADYKISFKLARRAYGGQQTVDVYFDALKVGTFTPSSTAFSAFYTNSFTATAGNHTIKFVGTNSAADNTAFLDDVALAAVQTSSPNLATGATASASATDTGNGYSPAKAIDGNKNDFAGWSSMNGLPQWFQLDFGANKTFNRVVLTTTSGYPLKDYDIQYWNGTSYVPLAQVRNNAGKEIITTFTPTSSSRLRINCLRGDQYNLARIDEIEVYGPMQATLTASNTDTGNGYSPAKAMDSNKADFNGWAAGARVPQWLLLDYGTNITFDKIVLNTTTDYLLKDYDIQSWTGSAYVTIAQVRNNTLKEVITTFTPVNSSRIRIYCITGDRYSLARVDEIEVFNGSQAARTALSTSGPAIPVSTITEEGVYQWQNTGWVAVGNAERSSALSENTWRIAKKGDLFVYNALLEENPETEEEVILYPNPAKKETVISYPLAEDGEVIVHILTMEGKRIKSFGPYMGKKGDNRYALSIEGVKSGLYMVELISRESTQSVKLVVED